MKQITYDCYSVDASVMIDLKDSLPPDLFKQAWDEISRLVISNRWKIFETVAEELHDEPLKDWVKSNPLAIVKFDANINAYINKLMSECQNNNMMIVNPYNTKNSGDPFVIMLALYFEGRDLKDLKIKTSERICCVLTSEKLREHKINIPSLCNYYNIPCMDLFDLMRYHQWQISINVQNP